MLAAAGIVLALAERTNSVGQMKIAQGAGQLRLRGLENTQGEWTLQAFCHNVRKLRNSGFHWIPGQVIS